MDVNSLFENRTTKKYIPHKREYDVKITLNKSGHKSSAPYAVRFGFLNRAVEAFSAPYIQVSIINKETTRIYFRSFQEKKYLDVHKLSKSRGAESSLYVTITPDEKTDKAVRSNWANMEYELKYDPDAKLYYIDREGVER